MQNQDKQIDCLSPTIAQIEAMRKAGWIITNGKRTPCGFGYYPAKRTGGYDAFPVMVGVKVEKLSNGCPASHAIVGYFPRKTNSRTIYGKAY
jgi:hypothetical protein